MGKESPCLSCKHKNVYEPLTKCFVCNFSGIECKNFEMYKPNSQTNADKIRAMTDEELAELFEMIPNSGNPPTYTIDGFCIDDGLRTKRQWLDWLRQEVNK